MHRISGWPDIRPDNPAFLKIRCPAGYRICWLDIRPDTGIPGTSSSGISGKSITCDHENLLLFIETLQKNCPLLMFEKENIHKSSLMKLPVGHIFTINLYVEPDIRQDIR
jgi:hypothetical protein